MSVNEILLIAVSMVGVVMLFSGIIFRFVLFYRNQIKILQEEARKMRHDILRDSMKMTEERNRMVREYNMVIQKRDQTIEKLRKKVKQCEDVVKQCQEAIKPEDKSN
ncbi:hypothetical protein [Bartonella doshiae]|uniref:Uncharacterized protein n=2 Tax=Bartonella doshiae TaxID=33044 RepID=A0A380ZE34_BARDO|nr:hypothetical protein [Bartonella doshiae]EJF81069.1 hypothetical protein MCS_00782 [Bartonella doshiae NCTC 12862 = ATCC 700133]MBB6159221.1 seryl-tRNA synthetase [Bartonella doshiae]SUV45217.1 Uncharacterised protein [Bartonella doshiae]